jgi:hypothetical protein
VYTGVCDCASREFVIVHTGVCDCASREFVIVHYGSSVLLSLKQIMRKSK